jgi:hypothetical protein
MPSARGALEGELLSRNESRVIRTSERRIRNEKLLDGSSERGALTCERDIRFADSDGRSTERGVWKGERLFLGSESAGWSSVRVSLPSESGVRASPTTALAVFVAFLTTE